MNERERIELLMKCYDLTPSQFADRTGIQRASVSHIISGRNKPSLEVLLKIYDAFPELDIEWLMTGKGEEPVAKTYGSSDAVVEENTLFSQPLQPEKSAPQMQGVAQQPMTSRYNAYQETEIPQARASQAVRPVERQRKAAAPKVRQQQASNERRIKEIRIFYTDGTYETLFPEK
ncbi:MAG: helix-turn-helix transcriptional regulator [Bacteroidaceae bacterium]|nr:helix-turn-helix transcriptional regulator [Bacteroidaceae bacterium]